MKNNSEVFMFLCEQMGKVADGEIDVNKANSIANLAKQANNCIAYELKRAETQMKINEHNFNFLPPEESKSIMKPISIRGCGNE